MSVFLNYNSSNPHPKHPISIPFKKTFVVVSVVRQSSLPGMDQVQPEIRDSPVEVGS